MPRERLVKGMGRHNSELSREGSVKRKGCQEKGMSRENRVQEKLVSRESGVRTGCHAYGPMGLWACPGSTDFVLRDPGIPKCHSGTG